ncbi:MAG TPA: hypothetical protein VL728_18915 [Cyclobacteriaceae bacterium]|nr:hypothetical protein [Cyclobacteriaceae bacterium]
MDTLVLKQFLRELALTGSTMICAYFLVGGLILVEKALKRAIIHSVRR